MPPLMSDNSTLSEARLPLAEWKALLKCSNVATFDVFDTVLGRDALYPHDVHVDVGRRLQMNGIPVGILFKRRRLTAEKTARRTKKSYPTLSDIYAELAKSMRWNECQTKKAMLLEMEAEREFSLRLEHGTILLKHARSSGKFAGFISDMYLPSNFIAELLKRSGLWQDGDRIWVSCEKGASKSNGQLFEIVRQELCID